MQDYWFWWGLSVLGVVLEIVTGTFYLLILAIGLAAGGIVAFLGGAFALQLLASAGCAVAGWLLLRRVSRRGGKLPDGGDRNLLLDIGERVRVEHWKDGRRTQVVYRGANWDAELSADEPAPAEPGEFVIRRIDGNRLVLSKAG